MKRQRLESMTDAELIDLYAHYAGQYAEGIDIAEVKNSNRAYKQLLKVRQVLKDRGSASRQAVASLLDHPDPGVRYMAANYLLPVMPVLARSVIQSIAEPYRGPISGYARDTLKNLDSGFYVPT